MSIGATEGVAEMTDAAFGSNPAMWPLPTARNAAELWLRAVAAAGQGRYGSALADLDRLHRSTDDGPLLSLALSTRASFHRQLGWHDRARPLDGQALARAGADAESRADAFIGLAADALGVGRLAASARALACAAEPVERATAAEPLKPARVGRLPVRLAWVSAELAMVSGDGRSAIEHAAGAVELAAGLGSVRHRVKSQVILAAAQCCGGEVAASRRTADEALREAGRHGLYPLRWAAASLLADIGSTAHSPAEIVRIRDECVSIVTRWGGVWRPR